MGLEKVTARFVQRRIEISGCFEGVGVGPLAFVCDRHHCKAFSEGACANVVEQLELG